MQNKQYLLCSKTSVKLPTACSTAPAVVGLTGEAVLLLPLTHN